MDEIVGSVHSYVLHNRHSDPCSVSSRASFACCFQLCVILEPMQELMSRHKAYGLSPRDCLKTTLFQKWQRMVAPPGESGHHHHQGAAHAEHAVDSTGQGGRTQQQNGGAVNKRRVYLVMFEVSVVTAATAAGGGGWGVKAGCLDSCLLVLTPYLAARGR